MRLPNVTYLKLDYKSSLSLFLPIFPSFSFVFSGSPSLLVDVLVCNMQQQKRTSNLIVQNERQKKKTHVNCVCASYIHNSKVLLYTKDMIIIVIIIMCAQFVGKCRREYVCLCANTMLNKRKTLISPNGM